MRLWFSRLKVARTPALKFIDSPVALVDRDLELVEPSVRWVEPMLMTAHSPACQADPAAANLTRRDLLRFLDHYPRGRQHENPAAGHAHGYTYWMRLRDGPVEMAGSISLRIGDDENLRCYLGHVGYGVYVPARGRRLAERATRLLLPLARAHGMTELWITANPENMASRRTCESLGSTLVDVVKLPTTHPLYLRGERVKCRYRLDLR